MQMTRFDGSDWLAPAAAVHVRSVQVRATSTPALNRLVLGLAALLAAVIVAFAFSTQANASTSRPKDCIDASWSSGPQLQAFRPQDGDPCSRLNPRLARPGRRGIVR